MFDNDAALFGLAIFVAALAFLVYNIRLHRRNVRNQDLLINAGWSLADALDVIDPDVVTPLGKVAHGYIMNAQKNLTKF